MKIPKLHGGSYGVKPGMLGIYRIADRIGKY